MFAGNANIFKTVLTLNDIRSGALTWILNVWVLRVFCKINSEREKTNELGITQRREAYK